MTQRFNKVHPIKATSSDVQYLTYIITKELKELSNGELQQRKDIAMCLGLGYFVDMFDEHMRPLFIEVITLVSIT